MELIIDHIINIEWAFFDKAQNIGGRADCQDNWKTFYIMRSSQFRAWEVPILESYFGDLQAAENEKRNPVAEKYGYMMARTSPAEYAAIADQLPPRSPEKLALIDRQCERHVVWLEDLAARYPRLTGNGRPIRREADGPWQTSFETYLWGELSTYSMATLKLYDAFTQRLEEQGKNLNEMVLLNEVRQYGFESLDAVEKRVGPQ